MLTPLLFVWIFIPSVKCGYYFVTVPNVIRFDNDETVTVSVFEQNNAAVKIWLQYGEKQFSAKVVVVPNEENPVTTTVKVAENDLFDTAMQEKPRSVLVCSQYEGQRQCREVILSYETGYLIVQTNKPIYTPLDEVKVRTLALDEHLRAVDGWEVVMDIIVKRYDTEKVKVKVGAKTNLLWKSQIPFSNDGIKSPSNMTVARRKFSNNLVVFFQHEFRLPPKPETGIWTARAFYSGQFETEARALFDVQEYVLPTFGVSVQLDVPVILPETSKLKAKVNAKYWYGLAVKGSARLTLFLKNVNGVSEYLVDVSKKKLENGVAEFIINMDGILNSYLEKSDFPDKCHLEVVASVFESDTGKEEFIKNDNTVFAFQPYVFKFTKSKRIFRPGLTYSVKVAMLHANGQPVAGMNIRLKMHKNGRLYSSEDTITDSKGMAIVAFPTSFEDFKIAFTAATTDGHQESENFEVTGFIDDNQITVESLISQGETLTRATSNNMGFAGSTGMLFLVVSRGKVVYTKFKKGSYQATEILTEDIKAMIAPSARVLVFYVNKGTNVLVADSVKMEVDQKCRDRVLKLDAGRQHIIPGTYAQLIVEGDPLMWVGLSVMDKALLNDRQVLLKTKVFKALASHDLGCGEGSGVNSADVFKKTGLTVLTNAALSIDDLQRNSVDCDETKRKKRNSRPTECYYNADMACCNRGYEFAQEVMNEPVNQERLDPSTKCHAKSRTLVKEIQTTCLMAFFTSCKTELEFLLSRERHTHPHALDEETGYTHDLSQLADYGVRIRARRIFLDSFLFEILQLDETGIAKTRFHYPDSITEWMFQAVGITSDKGLCVADSVNITAFRRFFIQLDLPYAVSRFQRFDVKATIFNNGLHTETQTRANIYLEGVENLCYSSESGNPSPQIQVQLPPNSAQTVSFPMIPLKKGKFPIKVTAIAIDSGIPEVDAVEKPIHVVNGGIEEQITIKVCLDPNKQLEDCRSDYRVFKDVALNHQIPGRVLSVDLTLPHNSIPGTGSATAYVQGYAMDKVVSSLIEGVDALIERPTGSGESTMIGLAKTVYAMTYLKETNQMTADIESRGFRMIREGVTRQVSQFRRSDGSYAAWQHRQSSTWLTTFVTKVFCQAKRVVDDVEDIIPPIFWLIDHVTDDGQFIDHMPVIHREMIGQIEEKDPSLTAFVLATLLECNVRLSRMQIIQKSTHFLENLDQKLLRNSPYILALSTYALAMANSVKKWEFKNLLHSIENSNGLETYWGNTGGNSASVESVETTAYALLAMIEFDDWKTSASIVRWLTSQSYHNTKSRSLQDTVVSLQALSTYTMKSALFDVDLRVEVLAADWNGYSFELTRENIIAQRIITNLPVEHKDNNLAVRVTGTGTGIMIIDLRYNRPATEEERCPFEISPIEIASVRDFSMDTSNCDVCGHCDQEDFELSEEYEEIESTRQKREADERAKEICIKFSVRSKTEKEFGMSVVNFGLGTGVRVVQDDLDKLQKETQNIDSYEMPGNGKGFIVFYLQKITSRETKFIFRLKDEFEGNTYSRQPSSVKVYDYYHPDQSCSQFYGTGPNQSQGPRYTCDKEQVQCKCLQSLCAQPVEETLLKLARRRKLPALKLYKYTCNPEKANYAVLVHIKSTSYNLENETVTAIGTILKSLSQGLERLVVDDDIEFFWNVNCHEPRLEENGEYYIIGKDAYVFETSFGGKKYMYPLMGTTLVIKNGQNKLLVRIMNSYEKLLNIRNGCNH